MSVSEHANYLLNEYGRLQFDYAAYRKPYGESLRNEARNNLEDYIAELEAERRWIPVGEKPLEAGTFFVLLKNGEVTKDFTFIDGGRYYWWNHGANITHYMPLPEPPIVYGKVCEE